MGAAPMAPESVAAALSSRNEIFMVPTGFVGKIIGRNFYNRESLVKNQRERRTLGTGSELRNLAAVRDL